MTSRYKIMVVVFGIIASIWTLYLFSLQVFNPFNFSGTLRNRYTPQKEILIPTRGSIYDANGSLLVSSISYYQIDIDRAAVDRWAKLKKITLDDAYQQLCKVIAAHTTLPAGDIMKRLKMGNKLNSIQITNKVRESELDGLIKAFDEKNLPGLSHSFSSMRRIYSKGILAARFLGSTRAESDGYDPATMSKSLYKMSGICGIEATYDDLLAGEYGWREYVLDAYQERVPYPNLHEKKALDGRNIKLTIDSNIQEVVENALFEGVETYNAKNAGAVVLDPKTGRILAMAGVSPEDRSIDPNLVRVKANIPASFMFEPGSTQKPLTMLAALDRHLVRYNETIPCGVYKTGKRTISDTHQYGPLTPRGIIAKSSNVGIARIAERIGKTNLYEKFISFGYGQKTSLGLYGETSGMFAKLQNWDGYTMHSISFGQGISVTALQHAVSFGAVANGGKMMRPYVVDSISDERGNILEQFEPHVLRQISSKAAADTVLSYMQSVVDNGTGKHIKLEYITLAGKTGTAQKNVEGTRGYSSGQYTSVFVGTFPVEDPRMVIVVFYDEPAIGYHYGSTSAAPTFKKIVSDILFMPGCNILAFNDRLMATTLTMPDLKGKSLREAESILTGRGFTYKVVGADSSSVVVDQFPKPNVAVERGHPITVKVGRSGAPAATATPQGMPSFEGLTVRKALQLASAYKIPLKIKGSGIVRAQSIEAGSHYTRGAVCLVEASL